MPVMDEFREEREAMKQKSFKERFSYFCEYYKWHVIGGVALAALAVSLIHSVVTRKEWAFYGAFVNSYQTPEYDAFRDDFADLAGIDQDKFDVLFDTNMFISESAFDQGNVDATERLMVYIAAGDVDVMASGPLVMNRYAYNEMFLDLRQVLPQEMQDQLEPYYYYMDATLAAELDARQESGALNTAPQYPAAPSDPESMDNPVPVGLYIQNCPRIKEAFVFQEEDVILGVMGNAENLDTILALIRMIYEF
ncbi:MAG: hypothetical protein HFH80_07560 [Lachnospiraceae bacterium]|nr:hypothetical protein [Lachnospiraceae bacterium]